MSMSMICSPSSLSLLYAEIPRASLTPSSFPRARIHSSFKTGTPLVIRRSSTRKRSYVSKAGSSIRCEQSSKGSGGLDVWLSRLAMVGFSTAIAIEIATGKGLLENLGFMSPSPTVALAVTGLVGALTAFFIFQSASRN